MVGCQQRALNASNKSKYLLQNQIHVSKLEKYMLQNQRNTCLAVNSARWMHQIRVEVAQQSSDADLDKLHACII